MKEERFMVGKVCLMVRERGTGAYEFSWQELGGGDGWSSCVSVMELIEGTASRISLRNTRGKYDGLSGIGISFEA
jgi:hypothetical protein